MEGLERGEKTQLTQFCSKISFMFMKTFSILLAVVGFSAMTDNRRSKKKTEANLISTNWQTKCVTSLSFKVF